MGKVTGSLRLLSVIVILSMIGLVIGCSDSNPVGKTGVLTKNDINKPVNGQPGTGKDDFGIGEGGGAFEEEITGEYADEDVIEHLYFGLSSSMTISTSSETIGKSGGVLQVPGKYDPEEREYTITVRSNTFSDDLQVGLELRAGTNKFSEELILCYVTPNFEHLNYNMLFTYNDDPCESDHQCAQYELYYFAGGRWMYYGFNGADDSGLVSLSLPAFGLYAILKRGEPGNQEPNTVVD